MTTTLSTRAADAGRLCMVGGVVGALSGVVTAFVPPAVDTDRYSYPFTPGWHLVAQSVYLLSHLLLIGGVIGVSRAKAAGTSALARWGNAISLIGLTALCLCEVVGMTLLNAAFPSAEAALLGTGYGVATLLIGTGLTLLGIGVVKAHVWDGWRRWTVLACGVAVFVIVLPGVFGPFLVGRIVLTVWMAMFVALGAALQRRM